MQRRRRMFIWIIGVEESYELKLLWASAELPSTINALLSPSRAPSVAMTRKALHRLQGAFIPFFYKRVERDGCLGPRKARLLLYYYMAPEGWLHMTFKFQQRSQSMFQFHGFGLAMVATEMPCWAPSPMAAFTRC